MVNPTAGLVGVVLLVRHGDRAGVLFQDYTTYSSTQGYLTPYGSVQEHDLGCYLRQTYIDPASPSYIHGINTDVADVDQLYIRADAGGGNVILDSAYALLQGLYPPTSQSNSTLADGQTFEAPLGGYQYIPVESLEFWQAPSLTSWMDCEYFQFHLARLNKGVFNDIAARAAPFLQAVEPYLNGLNSSFLNIWNIYDYLNVQYTHNATFYKSFPNTLLQQARYFADIHEQNVFTDSAKDSIGQIAIRTLWPEISWSLGNMTLPDNKVKLALTEVDYKPFISLFNVTNATVTNPEIAGIVDYASAVALELSQNTAGEYEVALKFKNGTDDKFKPLQMFGQDSLTLPRLIKTLDWTTVNSTVNWCFSCNQTVLRGCSVFNFSNDLFLHGFSTGFP